jgi:hypothetical protein
MPSGLGKKPTQVSIEEVRSSKLGIDGWAGAGEPVLGGRKQEVRDEGGVPKARVAKRGLSDTSSSAPQAARKKKKNRNTSQRGAGVDDQAEEDAPAEGAEEVYGAEEAGKKEKKDKKDKADKKEKKDKKDTNELEPNVTTEKRVTLGAVDKHLKILTLCIDQMIAQNGVLQKYEAKMEASVDFKQWASSFVQRFREADAVANLPIGETALVDEIQQLRASDSTKKSTSRVLLNKFGMETITKLEGVREIICGLLEKSGPIADQIARMDAANAAKAAAPKAEAARSSRKRI